MRYHRSIDKETAMLLIRRIATVTLAAVLGACASSRDLPVRVEYDRSTDFSTLKLFRFTEVDTPTGDYDRHPRLERLTEQAIESELVERGYQRADDGPTDFRVSLELIFRGRNAPGSIDGQTRADSQPAAAPAPRQVGTLIVRFHHPGTNAVLWTGTISGFTVGSVEPSRDLARVVWRVLAEFPPLFGE
jgi:hypothetical protein